MPEAPKLEIKLFYCYAREDKILRDELEIHLSLLRRQYHLTNWHDREILPGENWEKTIDTHLSTAHIILLLISPHFMYSDYCYGKEMAKALEREKTGTCRVIPILLRPTDWEDAPFSHLELLPTDARPVTTWADRDSAFWDIAKEIRKAIKKLLTDLKTKEQELESKTASLSMPTETVVAYHKEPPMPVEPSVLPVVKEFVPIPTHSKAEGPASSEVLLTHQVGKTFLPVSSHSQSVLTLLEVKPTELLAQVRMPLNFVLVLDHSGSMKGAKLKYVKEAARMFIDRLEPTDYISLVIFDDTSQVVIPSMPANDKPGMKAVIDRIRDAGGTSMSLGMIQGLNELRRWNIANSINRMILLTDGVTYGDMERCRQLARDAAAAGIVINTIGIGADWDQDLMDSIGTLSGGQPAESIHDPANTQSVFLKLLQSAANVVVRNTNLILRLPAGVSLKKAALVQPIIKNLDLGPNALFERQVTIPLGDLAKDEPQSVLVELMVDPRPEGIVRIAMSELTFDIPITGITGRKIHDDVTITFTRDTFRATTPTNPLVMHFAKMLE